jgi:hypothetical protein
VTDAPEDRDLDAHLAGGSRLSREYAALGREEPPPALDARIRAAAAAAVPAPARRRRSPLWWLRPAALAASVVLAFSLVLRLGEQAPSVATTPGDDEPGPVVVDLAGAPDVAEAPAPAVPPPGLAEPGAVAAAPPAEVRLDGLLGAAEQSRAPAPLAATPPAEAQAKAERVDSVARESPAWTTLTATAMKPGPRDAVERAIDAIRTRVGVAPPAAAAPADAASAGGASPDAAREATPATADDRLRAILALHDAGRRDEAEAALAAFARDFPDDPVAALVVAP